MRRATFNSSSKELVLTKLHDVLRILVEVAVAEPRRPHASVGQSRPTQSVAAIRMLGEVHFANSLELGAGWKIDDPLELHRDLVIPTNHERDAWVLHQILIFA